ncbi:MAG TPA: hypothetical protein DIT15_05920 [Arthrobacter bacterium]|nr:hypothetical protein [Arthrobacter sp.]HBH58305.1 hypothetical protein [Arthrobacter sp.]HCB56694.1 hypothetical protein [Arthrobacter sp.]HCN21770.1 hypothetical protein [Arthrobacter sp.]
MGVRNRHLALKENRQTKLKVTANTRDGLAAARARGRTGGRRPKLAPDQAHHAQQLYDAGDHTVQRIADLLQVPRSTIYGHLNKTRIGRRPTPAP